MKKFKIHQRPRRKYRFNIVGHKKALKIWRDSPFNVDVIYSPEKITIVHLSVTLTYCGASLSHTYIFE